MGRGNNHSAWLSQDSQVWLWPFAFQKNIRKEAQVIPHVRKHFQLSPGHMLQADREKLQRTQLCIQPPAELGGRLLKRKKKRHKLYIDGCGGRGEGKMQWANVPSWHLPFDSKKKMAFFQNFSIIVVSAASWTRLKKLRLPTEQDKISVNRS